MNVFEQLNAWESYLGTELKLNLNRHSISEKYKSIFPSGFTDVIIKNMGGEKYILSQAFYLRYTSTKDFLYMDQLSSAVFAVICSR
jgi:hypothetical protein